MAGVSPYLRKVKTASGAVAVQIVAKEHGVRRIVEHLGSAHNEVELAALVRLGHSRLAQGQLAFDFGQDSDATGQDAVGAFAITSKRSKWLIETITNAWEDLGFARAVNYHQAFFQLVAARLIQPSSLNEVPTVLGEIGWPGTCHRNTLQNALARAVERDYRFRFGSRGFGALPGVWGCVLGVVRRDYLVLRSRGRRRATQGRLLQGTPRRSPDPGRPAGRPQRFSPRGLLLGGQQVRNPYPHPYHRGLQATRWGGKPGGGS